MLYQRMLQEQEQLSNQIKNLASHLSTYPPGKLICTQNQNRSKWYVSDGHTQTYIPKKERPLAEQLAVKKYLSARYEELLQEQRAIEQYLKHHTTCHSQDLLAANSPYQELLAPFFKPISQELLEWTNAPYEHNTKFPEQRIHKSISGNKVRSKSEVLIDMALYTNKIPFRYECALNLNEILIFPDFTIRHPKTGNLYYWEHFGLMDDPSYCQNACSKLQLYSSHGIIPTIQLITTFETKKHPLNSDTIDHIIKSYFLN